MYTESCRRWPPGHTCVTLRQPRVIASSRPRSTDSAASNQRDFADERVSLEPLYGVGDERRAQQRRKGLVHAAHARAAPGGDDYGAYIKRGFFAIQKLHPHPFGKLRLARHPGGGRGIGARPKALRRRPLFSPALIQSAH